jgi:phosphoenolpyruvate-protein kinase (PTS system EI component)
VRDFRVPHSRIDPACTVAELKRYDQALGLVRDHLHEHLGSAHRDAGLEARNILDIHELILAEEQFHESVRRRVAE